MRLFRQILDRVYEPRFVVAGVAFLRYGSLALRHPACGCMLGTCLSIAFVRPNPSGNALRLLSTRVRFGACRNKCLIPGAGSIDGRVAPFLIGSGCLQWNAAASRLLPCSPRASLPRLHSSGLGFWDSRPSPLDHTQVVHPLGAPTLVEQPAAAHKLLSNGPQNKAPSTMCGCATSHILQPEPLQLGA